MGTFKQWIGWIIFDGMIPSAALLLLAQHMKQNGVLYYIVGLPPLFVYFYILGRLGLDIPGTLTVTIQEDESNRATFFKRVAGALGWFRLFGILFIVPALGAALILYAVRNGETVGYFMGPAVIWVFQEDSGLC